MRAQRETWYAAALATELAPGALLERTLLGEIVLLYRPAAGAARAIGGLCPHRFAPLVLGQVVGDEVQCGYHGLRFDGDGQCVHNPRGDGQLNDRMNVARYPLVERHGMLWIWMGDPDSADPALVPDFSYVENTPAMMRVEGYLVSGANFELVIDNLLDPSHADFVHADTLSSAGLFSRTPPHIERTGRSIAGIWEFAGARTQPIYHQLVGGPDALADQRHEFRWYAPSIVEINTYLRPEHQDVEFTNLSFHAVTPIDERQSHYWFIGCRNFADFGPEFNEMMRQSIQAAFSEEDKPMLEAIERATAGREFWSMHPAILDGDQISTMVRRHVDKMIKEQRRKAA